MPKKRRHDDSIGDDYETDETRGLGNAKLQRLVLLKQLKLLGMQIKQLEKRNSGVGEELERTVDVERTVPFDEF